MQLILSPFCHPFNPSHRGRKKSLCGKKKNIAYCVYNEKSEDFCTFFEDIFANVRFFLYLCVLFRYCAPCIACRVL